MILALFIYVVMESTIIILNYQLLIPFSTAPYFSETTINVSLPLVTILFALRPGTYKLCVFNYS